MKKFEAVLFDMDGILYDSEAYYMNGVIEVMKSLGYTGDEKALHATVGTTFEQTFQIYYDLLEGKYSMQEIIEVNKAYFSSHEMDYKGMMFPGVKEVLQLLKQDGRKIACCSSSPLETIQVSLEEMGIASLFDFVESGECIEHAKPYPDIYLKAAESFGIAIENCVVYEDSKLGIEAGKRAGAFVIARRDDRFSQDQSGADVIVNDIMEMYRVVQRGGK